MKGQHYYEQLTPEQQKRFKDNMNKQRPGDIDIFMRFEYDSIERFIFQSFTLDESPEGMDYWLAIARKQPVPKLTPTPEPIYNSGIMLGVFIGFLTGTLLTMATREWTYQLIGLDIILMAGIVYLYKKYRNEHSQAR